MGVQTDDLLAQVGELRRSIAADRRTVNEKWSEAEALIGQIIDGRGKRPTSRANPVKRLATALAALVLPIVVVGSLIGWTYGAIVFTALAFLVIEVGLSLATSSTGEKPKQDWVL
jgi:hypothetical protein